MRRFRLPLLIIPVILLLSTCEQFDPQWMGTWVDDTTVPDTVITLDFDKWEGTVTVENNDPAATIRLTVVEGSLNGDKDTILATITSLYQKYGDGSEILLTDPNLIFGYVVTPPDPDCPTCLGLEWPCSVSYHIEGETITLTGPLVSVLTDGVSDTLVAERL